MSELVSARLREYTKSTDMLAIVVCRAKKKKDNFSSVLKHAFLMAGDHPGLNEANRRALAALTP